MTWLIMLTYFHLLKDVVIYRLKRTEFLYFLAALAIMLTFNFSLVDISYRVVFVLLLNLLAYLTHDYYDLSRDLASDKKPAKTRFLNNHRREAIILQVFLLIALLILAISYSRYFIIAIALGVSFSWLYTVWLKEVPLLDILCMFFWGIGMILSAIPFNSTIGWVLLGLMGFYSSIFQGFQIIDDYQEDKRASALTTAVYFGPKTTTVIVKFLMVLTTIYTLLLLNLYLAIFFLLPVFISDLPNAIRKYWNLTRLIYGTLFLVILVLVFFHKKTFGIFALT